ncbi:MarR family winged helix-turn-helix transcriptional regulator [Streptomyces sp. NPDC015127]|uniref:MarR family winged helix-turn-helix transcriptional regulator n=1 Tax=Streptomyces sp. NPDC015127 TaxID=3364939 RepID=UPI0036F82EF3
MRVATSGEQIRDGMNSVDAFSRSALAVFHLNGRFGALLDQLTAPAGLSAAQWQVLGAVEDAPQPVSGIARLLGVTRQSVQRIADLLVAQQLADYRANPAHRRARLLVATERGQAVLREIDAGHAELARRLCLELGGEKEFGRTTEVLRELSLALGAVVPQARS